MNTTYIYPSEFQDFQDNEPVFRETAVVLFPPRPYIFVAKQVGRMFFVEWQPHLTDRNDGNLWDFLQWARDWGASYSIRSYVEGNRVKRQLLELRPCIAEDHTGEYSRGLLYDLRAGREAGPVFRRFFSIMKMCQHALDGLPYDFYRVIPPNMPIFRVETKEGVFAHSLHTWQFWRPSKREDRLRLIDLAVRGKETEVDPAMDQGSLL